jgi:hypothetical protein
MTQTPNDCYKYTPNVEQIRSRAYRVIRGSIPFGIRKELMDAVRAGELGRLKKDGLKPEVFYHPDHLHGARDAQRREADFAISCIRKVMAPPRDPWE